MPTRAPETSAASTPTLATRADRGSARGGGPSGASLVMLADPLDEPEFYCVDVAGFGANLNVNGPLQAHTCKPGADDELFAFNRPADGQFYLVEHDRCIEADGASLYVRPCSESPLQRFAYGGTARSGSTAATSAWPWRAATANRRAGPATSGATSSCDRVPRLSLRCRGGPFRGRAPTGDTAGRTGRPHDAVSGYTRAIFRARPS